jgi:hypothetical protein
MLSDPTPSRSCATLKLRFLASAMEACGDEEEDRYEALRERCEQLSERVLARPVRAWADVIEIAEIAHFWATKNLDGELIALASPCDDDRIAAELIMAVLTMAKGGVNA